MIRFRALGGVELRGADNSEARAILTQPKRLALLAYLAIAAPGGFRRRDSVVGLFWPELDQQRARAALSQSVYQLRRVLGREIVVSRGSEDIGIAPGSLWCDVAAFDQAVADGDAHTALDLYRGDLFPGFFLSDAPEWEQWLEAERSRLRARAAEAAWRLAEAAEAAENAAEAAHWGRRALSLADDDEIQLARVVALLDRVGDRAGAVQAGEAFAQRLEREYQLDLAPETRALIAQVRSRQSSPAAFRRTIEPQPAPDAVPSGGDRAAAGRTRRRGGPVPRVRLAAALTMVLLLAVAIVWSALADRAAPLEVAAGSPGDLDSRVAVLPFVSSGSDRAVYLADGLTEQLISRLSSLSGLQLVARTSVVRLRDSGRNAEEIGRELGVGALLEGSVDVSDDRVRITVRLVNTATRQALWAGDYEAALRDVEDLERRIAEAAAGALRVEWSPSEYRRLVRRGSADPEAYALYLRGRHYLAKSDEASFSRARDAFEEALRLDPDYAQAWSGLSDAYDHLAGSGVLPTRVAYLRARDAAERALELDPELAEAHASLAVVLSYYARDWQAAERRFNRAIELDASYARAYRTYSGHLRVLGRLDEARAAAGKAAELDPVNFFTLVEPVLITYFERDYDRAIARARRLAAMGPDYGFAHFALALALVQRGASDEALEALDAVDPDDRLPDAVAVRGYIRAVSGDRGRARHLLGVLDDLGRSRSVAFHRAVIHLGLDEADRALSWLERAYWNGEWRVNLLKGEPLFDTLRREARFQEILEMLGMSDSPANAPAATQTSASPG